MMTWLSATLSDDSKTPIYFMGQIKEKYEVTQLNKDGYLVLNWCPDKFWLQFAVLTFYSSDLDGSNVWCELLFNGHGPSDSLRECRHTYWGENGYVFYPNAPVIVAAFEALSEFFDGMK